MALLPFLLAALALSALAMAAVLAGYRSAARPSAAERAVLPLRRRLAEVDALQQDGLITAAEHRAARALATRRLLEASEAAARPGHGPIRPPAWLWTLSLLAPVLAALAYGAVGAPGLADQPYRVRLEAWRNTDPSRLRPEQIAAVLSDLARRSPADPEPLKHLARVRGASGDRAGAVEALRRAVALAPNRGDLWTDLGEVLTAQDEGRVGPEAREAFARALDRDPGSASALYHLAKAKIADGDLAGGLADWRRLRARLAPDDPRRRALSVEIASVAAGGGMAPTAAPASAPADQAIATMVQGLAERLARDPDDPAGWVRLVRAYAVLGDQAQRDAALAQALARFGDQPKIVSALRQAADARPVEGPGA